MLNLNLFAIRLKKLVAAICCPKCWKALTKGVVPTIEHFPVLNGLNIDAVVDVGANRGQFTLACQMALPDIPVVAFEPISSEADIFKKIHGSCPNIRIFRTALGKSNGEATLHLSQKRDSSSLLPIGALQKEIFKGTEESGVEKVLMTTLDQLSEQIEGSRLLLKLDVQGYELAVLCGAETVLPRCAYVYAECSEVSLYDGQALRAEVEDFLSKRGFKTAGRWNPHFESGKLIQADWLFANQNRKNL